MAAKSRRLTKQQWHELVKEQAVGSLTREAFCKSRSINKHTFSYWQQKFKSALPPALSPATPDFIEIKRPSTGELCAAGWDVELALGKGIILRLRVS